MLHPKLFNLSIAWFISTVLIVAVTPSKAAAQEIENLSAIADNSAEVLLAQTLQEQLDAFFNSEKYTYCDAKILGKYWGKSEVDAY